MASKRLIIAWCLGLTQHEHGVDTVREIANLLLLRGNIGREGAGPCPPRAQQVQGNAPAGSTTVQTRRFSIGSPRSAGSTHRASTKLNRSHIVHGKRALILPCLGRTDKDYQASGVQGITVEDSMSMVHISYGMKEPGSPQLRSECAILAGMAQATLPESETPWQGYADNYDRIRDTMARVLPGFEDFNTRARHPQASASVSRHGSVSSRLPLVAPSSRWRRFRTTSIPARAACCWRRSARTTSSTPRSTRTTTATAA